MVALNLGNDPAEIDVPDGMVRIDTRHKRDGERVGGSLTLGAVVVAEEFGDQDGVFAVADELGGEGVAQDVRAEGFGGVVTQSDGVAEAGDDVAGGAVAQAAAAVVEEHRGVGAGPLPIGAGLQPVGQGLAQIRMDGQQTDLAAVAALARMRSSPLRADRRTSARSRPTTSEMRRPA